MNKEIRMYVNPGSKSVIYSKEDLVNTFNRINKDLPPLSYIHSVRQFDLLEGHYIQSNGEQALALSLNKGDYVEVTADDLVFRKRYSNQQLDSIATRLQTLVGNTSNKGFRDIRNLLVDLELGNLPDDQILQAEENQLNHEKEQYLASIEPSHPTETRRNVISRVATEIIKDFDETGVVDWRKRESCLAKLRNKVRMALKKEPGTYLLSIVNNEVDKLLAI